jgi:outer membrane protein OmpA-like peptidoglycan-associated protein
MSLDRVYFETGKSVLIKESQKQVENIAAILKSFPSAKIKIGGYTDNSGSVATNMKVSSQRAKMVLSQLVKLGSLKDNLMSEGYGPEHPVSSNDTPEGRAQNRRVDVRVTQK